MPTNSIWDLSEIGSRHQRKTPFFICRLPDCLYTAKKVLSRPQTPWSRADARQFAGELPRGLDRADGALPTRRGERRSLDCRPEKKARPQVWPRSLYRICRHTLSKRAGGIATSRRRQCAGWGARGARVCGLHLAEGDRLRGAAPATSATDTSRAAVAIQCPQTAPARRQALAIASGAPQSAQWPLNTRVWKGNTNACSRRIKACTNARASTTCRPTRFRAPVLSSAMVSWLLE